MPIQPPKKPYTPYMLLELLAAPPRIMKYCRIALMDVTHPVLKMVKLQSNRNASRYVFDAVNGWDLLVNLPFECTLLKTNLDLSLLMPIKNVNVESAISYTTDRTIPPT